MNTKPSIKSILLSLALLLSALSPLAVQASNPVLGWIGQPYGIYHDSYKALSDSLFEGPHRDHRELLRLLADAAEADPSGEWELNRQLVSIHTDMYRHREGGFVINGGSSAEEFARQFLEVAAAAQQKQLPLVRLRAIFDAAECYRLYAQNYERAFSLYNKLVTELASVSTRDFPMRPNIYREVANLYFHFREYDDAKTYYRIIAQDPEAKASLYLPYYPALHGLGICYRNGEGDYVRSDSCFHALLDDVTKVGEPAFHLWGGIAEGSLGQNQYLQGHYDAALPLLLSAARDITRPNDYAFLSQIHVSLVDIYLGQRNIPAAGRHLDRALELHRATLLPMKSPELYRVQSKYMAYTGHPEQAAALVDSVLSASARDAEAFSGLVLRRVEQRLRESDNRIATEKVRFYRSLAIIAGIGLVVFLALLSVIASLYRKKHRAYRELVRRNQQWAGVRVKDNREGCEGCEHNEECSRGDDFSGSSSSSPTEAEQSAVPDEYDREIMKQLLQIMETDKLYKRDNITLDSLAKHLGYARSYISRAINRCEGHNFYAFINEYRVKEVIRLLSQPSTSAMTVDEIATESGFNDRITLYRVFKKNTGLSLTEFRKNISMSL